VNNQSLLIEVSVRKVVFANRGKRLGVFVEKVPIHYRQKTKSQL